MPPFPPAPPGTEKPKSGDGAPSAPCAPAAATTIWLTPAGTTNDCTAPTKTNVQVAVPAATTQFAGSDAGAGDGAAPA